MKGFQLILVLLLTAACLLLILCPPFLQTLLPGEVLSALSFGSFPLLDTVKNIAADLVRAVSRQENITLSLFTAHLNNSLLDALLAFVMVSALTLPLGLILGKGLYEPLYRDRGILVRSVMYLSLNLVCVVGAWVLYRLVFYRYVVEGLVFTNIGDDLWRTVADTLVQFFSAAAIGAIALRIALAAVATRVVVGKILMPVLGALVRTLLFSFFIAFLLMLHVDLTLWPTVLGFSAIVLGLCCVTDWICA